MRVRSRFSLVIRIMVLASGRLAMQGRGGLRSIIMLAAAGAGLLCGLLTASAIPIEEALDLLRREGVDLSEPALQESVVEAVFQAVDSQGRILTTEEARWMEQQRQGRASPQFSMSNPPVESGSDVARRPAFSPIEYWPREIAYLKFNSMDPGCAPAFGAALAGLNTATVYGVILDLRGVGGEGLESVAEVAGWFSASNEFAVVRNHAGKEFRRLTNAVHSTFRHPLMILTDGQTREAAELLAALCQGQARVMLIGVPTRGEAYLRDLIPLSDGRFLDFARYRLAPLACRDYHGRGVTPDIDVAYVRLDAEGHRPAVAPKKDAGQRSGGSTDSAAVERLDERIGTDLILRRAVDLLMGLKALETGGYATTGDNPN